MRYSLRSKNKGKRWGIWDRQERKWQLKPGFFQALGHTGDDGTRHKLGPPEPLNVSASEVANQLPAVIEMRNAEVKKQQQEKKENGKQIKELPANKSGGRSETQAGD